MMKIENVNVNDLIPYEFNNKKHDKKQVDRIANSIKEFWFLQPLVIDKDNIIVVGHWRLEGAKKLWLKEVPCIRAENLTDVQIKKYRILDNKLNESDWDADKLKMELDELGDLDFGDIKLDLDEEFGELLKDIEEEVKKEEEKPEVEFSEELLEEHNYVVLYFDNTTDWMTACDVFGIEQKKRLWTIKGVWVWRVIRWDKVLNKILKNGN